MLRNHALLRPPHQEIGERVAGAGDRHGSQVDRTDEAEDLRMDDRRTRVPHEADRVAPRNAPVTADGARRAKLIGIFSGLFALAG